MLMSYIIYYFNLFLTNTLCMFYVPISISVIAQSEIKLLLYLLTLTQELRRRQTHETVNALRLNWSPFSNIS